MAEIREGKIRGGAALCPRLGGRDTTRVRFREGIRRSMLQARLAVVLGEGEEVVERDRAVAGEVADGPGGTWGLPVVLGDDEQVREIHFSVAVGVAWHERRGAELDRADVHLAVDD